MTPTDPKTEGRIPSLIGVLKKLLAEDPLIALIAFVILLPVGGGIASASLTGQFDILPILLAVEAGAIIFCCVPLIITKTWKQTQSAMKDERTDAVKAEASIRLEAEVNKQKRFNDLVTAKIENIKASTDYVLSQSDRVEREQLRQVVEELRGVLQDKGFNFVDPVVCTENVHKILQELSQVHMNFDTVFEAIGKIEASMKIEPTDFESKEPEIEGPPKEEVMEKTQSEYDELQEKFEETLRDNQELEKDKDNLNYTIANLRDDIRMMREKEPPIPEKLPEPLPVEGTLPATDVHVTQQPTLKEMGIEEQKLQEAMTALDSLEDEVDDEEEMSKLDKTKSAVSSGLEALKKKLPIVGTSEEELFEQHPEGGQIPTGKFNADQDVTDIEEAKKIVDEVIDTIRDSQTAVQQKPSPPVATYWTCAKCKRANPLKNIRCPACGSSKPQ
jgi:hypothetical protein